MLLSTQNATAQPYQLQRIDTPNPHTAHFRLVKALPPANAQASVGENVARHLAQLQHQIGLPVTCNGFATYSNIYGEFSCDAQNRQNLSVSAGKAENKQRWKAQLPQWPSAQHIIVSDLDDTLIRWPHHSLWRDVLTQNAYTRPAYNDAAAFLRAQDRAGATIVYLSNSPRSLLPEIRTFLQSNQLPTGDAIFLRPFNLSGQTHKARVLEALAQHSSATFTLLGDNKSHDPQLYATFAKAYPQRIEHIYLRDITTEQFSPPLP